MMQKLTKRLRSHHFLLAVVKVGSGNMVGQAVSILATPILSRVYSETAYGDHAIFVSVASIVVSFSTLGLNSAIMSPKDDDDAKAVFTTALIANVVLSSLFVMICAIFSRRMKAFAISGSYIAALPLLLVYMVLATSKALLTIYANRKGRYDKLFFNACFSGGGNLLIALPLGLMGFDSYGLILTGIFVCAVCCLHMAWGDAPIASNYRLSSFRKVLKEYKAYILFQYPSNFIGNAAIEYPTQFLGNAFSSHALGGYSMCLRVLKYPIRLIAAPISTVYFRTATERQREGGDLARFTYNMMIRILIISFLPLVVFCFCSQWLFAFALGEQWRGAGRIAAMLAPQYAMMFCSQCTSYCRVAAGKQKTNLLFTITHLVTIILACSIGHRLYSTLTGTVVFLSVGQCLCYIFDMSLNFYLLDRRFFTKYLLAAGTYAALLYAILFIGFNN